VGGIREGLECDHSFSCREIQFTGTTLSNVDGNDPSDFLSKWLDGNYGIGVSAGGHYLQHRSDLHG
jgi:hypothetical protein